MGGLAEHTHYQAEALHHAGVAVVVLTCPGYLAGRSTCYPTTRILADPVVANGLMAKVWRLRELIRRYMVLWRWLQNHPCRVTLLDSYGEYFAPFWVNYLAKIQRSGVVIGANLHDPVRDYRVGPQWWHDWSVSLAYQNLSFVLCHQKLPESSRVPPHVQVYTVPVGVYHSPPARADQKQAREQLDLPQDKRVFLSFGFLRDNKNLDLFIRAMSSAEDVFLNVAGRQQSGKDRPVSYYLDLATECKVVDRIRFDSDFILDENVPFYFAACDVVLLTYDASFHSQSGVLNIAARYRKPVLASSGESPLRDAVQDFRLGCFVAPDSEAAISDVLKTEMDTKAADWDGYFRHASWETNVAPLIQRLKHLKNADHE
jgi:glycosyltransferase involved in cell wall biosynthesis